MNLIKGFIERLEQLSGADRDYLAKFSGYLTTFLLASLLVALGLPRQVLVTA